MNNHNDATLLSAVGNVLEGWTNLAQLPRTDGAPAPLDTWAYFNWIS